MRWRRVFEFDPDNFRFGKKRGKIWRPLLMVLLYMLLTFTLAVMAYVVFAIFFRTDTEKNLIREMKMYDKLYPALAPRQELIGDAIANLQYKDNEIYEQVFHANAPDVDPMGRMDFQYASDTVPDTRLASYTRDLADRLLVQAGSVDEAFMKIFAALGDSAFVMPPMTLPIKDITYPQIGASTGMKMDPFYRAYVYHEGLDFIVARGTDVCASADGEVAGVFNSKKSGRTVEIRHNGGYTTTYAHLEGVSVRSGQKVKCGQKIGTVGMSGQAFAPHLHYEVRRDGAILNPVNYFFASVNPTEYANMLYMASNTRQSMD